MMKTAQYLNIVKKINSAKGFNLIEIVLAIAVAGAIFLVIANLPSSINLIGKSKNESIAKDVAAQTIENLRGQTYVNLANGSTTITDGRISSLPGGSGTTVIEDCPTSSCPGGSEVKKVTVTVSWTQNNEPKSVILTTLISDGGLQ